MNGHVFRRSPSKPGAKARAKQWAFVVELGSTGDGHRKQIWRSGFATKREAQEGLQTELQRHTQSVVVPVKRTTVEQFLVEQWLPSLVRVRPSTLRSYSGHVHHHLVPRLGSRPLRDLSTPDVNRLVAALSRSRSSTGTGLAPATVHRVHATLRVALADAVRWGLLPNNVASGAELPRKPKRDMQVWTSEQLRTFLRSCATDELGPLYSLIAHTGMRRGEAVGLRWRQVDVEGGQLLIDHQLIDNGYTSVSSGEPKSHRGRRVIALDPSTVLLLTRHRDAQKSLRRAAGLNGNPTFVFCREDGCHYHPEFVTRHFQVLVRRAHLPRLRLHDLRHTHATLGLAAGVPAKIMADRLGHSSVLLTLDTYSHVSPALDARAAGLIAELIAGEGEVIDNPM